MDAESLAKGTIDRLALNKRGIATQWTDERTGKTTANGNIQTARTVIRIVISKSNVRGNDGR